MRSRRRVAASLVCAAGLVVLGACEQKEEQAFAEPPPPEVTVAKPVVREVTQYLYATGTVVPVRKVEIRARVEGFLLEKAYTPGTPVKQGDLLFVIDRETYQAALDGALANRRNAEAAVAKAKANQEKARADLELAKAVEARFEAAFEKQAMAEVDVLEKRSETRVADAILQVATAELAVAEANLAVAHSEVKQRQIDLGHTRIHAPMAGRVADSVVEVGDLVGRDATLLTVIVDDTQVYAYFEVSEQDLAKGRDTQPDELNKPKITPLPTFLGLIHDEDYPHEGVLDYGDPELDRATGTLRVRAIFDNAKRRILPGMFVRLRIPLETQPGALLVPESALGLDQSGRYALVVNSEDMVERRAVEVTQHVEDSVVIGKGLGADDRVIVVGLQRARPGATVSPQERSPE